MDAAEAKRIILEKCPAWEALGISEVSCHYSGSGDEGSITHFEVDGSSEFEEAGLESSGDWPDKNQVYAAFDFLTFAEVTGDGDGGGGRITVDVKAKTIQRTEWYYQQTEVDAGTSVL